MVSGPGLIWSVAFQKLQRSSESKNLARSQPWELGFRYPLEFGFFIDFPMQKKSFMTGESPMSKLQNFELDRIEFQPDFMNFQDWRLALFWELVPRTWNFFFALTFCLRWWGLNRFSILPAKKNISRDFCSPRDQKKNVLSVSFLLTQLQDQTCQSESLELLDELPVSQAVFKN